MEIFRSLPHPQPRAIYGAAGASARQISLQCPVWNWQKGGWVRSLKTNLNRQIGLIRAALAEVSSELFAQEGDR